MNIINMVCVGVQISLAESVKAPKQFWHQGAGEAKLGSESASRMQHEAIGTA